MTYKGHMYYTKSVRRPRWVTSECWGRGEVAMLFARWDASIREEESLAVCSHRLLPFADVPVEMIRVHDEESREASLATRKVG